MLDIVFGTVSLLVLDFGFRTASRLVVDIVLGTGMIFALDFGFGLLAQV